MKQNVGGIDKTIRIAVGILLIILAAAGIIGWWGWLGIILLVTGLLSNCPLYRIFGTNTCRLDKK